MRAIKEKGIYLFFMYSALIYIALSAYYPFINVYYLNLGFSKKQIGLLSALGPMVSILVQPVWGIISDRSEDRRKVLAFSLCGTIISALLYVLDESYIYILIISIIYACFNTVTIPLGDAIAMSYIKKTGYRFSFVRMGGTLGYSISVLFIGQLINKNISTMFYINAILLFCTLFIIRLLPGQEREGYSKKKKSTGQLLKNKSLLFVLFYVLIVFLTLSFHGSFLGVYIKELKGTSVDIGIANSIAALSEIPVLIFIDRCIKRFGAKSILMFAGVMTGLRMIMFYYATDIITIFIAQSLSGVSFMVVYYCAVIMVDKETPDNLKSTGQSILAMVRTGAASILGSIGGGYLGEVIGLRNTFLLMSCNAFMVTVFFIISFTMKSFKDKEHGDGEMKIDTLGGTRYGQKI